MTLLFLDAKKLILFEGDKILIRLIKFSLRKNILLRISRSMLLCLFALSINGLSATQVCRQSLRTIVLSKNPSEPAPVSFISVSPDGKRILVGSDGSGVQFYDVATGQLGLSIDLDDQVTFGTFSPTRREVLIGTRYSVSFWNSNYGQYIRKISVPSQFPQGVFSMDGKTILTGGSNKFINVWDVETGGKLLHLTAKVGSLVGFSGDGSKIVSAAARPDKVLIDVYGIQAGRLQSEHQTHAPAFLPSVPFAISHDGHAIVGMDYGASEIIDIESGSHAFIAGHSDAVTSVASARGERGERLWLTGSRDRRAILWNGTKLLKTFNGHKSAITAVAFFLDGKRIVTGSADGTVSIWSVEQHDLAAQR